MSGALHGVRIIDVTRLYAGPYCPMLLGDLGAEVFKLSETPGEIKLPAPLLGQHNEEVYCGLLDYSKQQLASLAEEGII
jgi:crotonobetainyl-CoA:carnitine CoA-transferase CaiB-like acyl-CoA transferase